MEGVAGEGVEDSAAIGAFMPNRPQRRSARRDTRKLRKDPHRRRKYLSHVRSDHTVIRSTIATLEALLEHSSDTADPVFPSQRRLATLVGCDVRTIQRHIQELRQAGYLLVYVYAPERDASGRWHRRKTNRYYFTFTKTPGNGHRVRRNRRSHLNDKDVVMNSPSSNNHPPVEGGGGGLGLLMEMRKKKVTPSASRSSLDIGVSSDSRGCEVCDHSGWIFDDANVVRRCSCMG